MKAVGYIRVSKLDEEKGISVEAQKQKIFDYCRLKDLTLGDLFIDEGISGKNLDRPQFQKMMGMIAKDHTQHIVIWKLDRMFRSTKDALTTMEYFELRGIALHSIEENLDTKSAMGRFVFRLLASLAELEREIVGERMETMAAYKKSKGEHWGRRGRGFDVVDKIRVPSKDMNAILNMENWGLSIRDIAIAMNIPRSTVHAMIKSHKGGN